MFSFHFHRIFAMAAVVGLITNAGAFAAEGDQVKEPTTVKVFDALSLSVPQSWKPQPPKSRIVEHEFVVRPGEGDDADDAEGADAQPTARVTMMAAGGDVNQNIDRWKGQFSGGGEAKVEKFDAAGQTVHLVQLDGTFKETMGGGPFSGGKTVLRKDYGMLGAIIEMQDGRKYFIKMTGPEEIIAANRKEFQQMLKGLRNN